MYVPGAVKASEGERRMGASGGGLPGAREETSDRQRSPCGQAPQPRDMICPRGLSQESPSHGVTAGQPAPLT